MTAKKNPPATLLDGRMMTDRERAHAILQDVLCFPDYYGANLDALFDCLSTCGQLRMRLYFASAIRHSMGEYGDDLIDTLLDAARENDALRVTVYE